MFVGRGAGVGVGRDLDACPGAQDRPRRPDPARVAVGGREGQWGGELAQPTDADHGRSSCSLVSSPSSLSAPQLAQLLLRPRDGAERRCGLANTGAAVNCCTPPLISVGVSMWMERGRQPMPE